MKSRMVFDYYKISLVLFLLVFVLSGEAVLLGKEQGTSLNGLLPKVEDWKYSEEPMNFIPGNLYEYINGAAEIYLAYDFEELIVGQYEKEKDAENLQLELGTKAVQSRWVER